MPDLLAMLANCPKARHFLSSEVVHRLIKWGLVEETTGGLN